MEKQRSFEDSTMIETTSSSSAAATAPNHNQKTLLTTNTASSASISRDSAHRGSFSSVHSGFKSSEKKADRHITIKEGLSVIFLSSWVNVLLVFVPLGIASHFVWSPTVTFIMNFLAIIPLAKLLGFATEDIALRTGEVSISLNNHRDDKLLIW